MICERFTGCLVLLHKPVVYIEVGHRRSGMADFVGYGNQIGSKGLQIGWALGCKAAVFGDNTKRKPGYL